MEYHNIAVGLDIGTTKNVAVVGKRERTRQDRDQKHRQGEVDGC